MQEKSFIKKNILKFLDFKGLSKYEFYKTTGITRGILDQNNGMNEENTAIFLAVFKEVSAEWLLRGEGDMLKNQDHISKAPPDKKKVVSSPPCEMCRVKDELIETQRKYIYSLEDDLKQQPGEAGQKRKAG